MLNVTPAEAITKLDAGARAFQTLWEENNDLARWLWSNVMRPIPMNLIYQWFVWQWPKRLPQHAYFAVYLSLEFLVVVYRERHRLGN